MQELVEELDYDELHQDNLDALPARLAQELNLLLDGDEEAHLVQATSAADLAERIQHVTRLAWHRHQKAQRAFGLLDEAGKGVVVLEDLRRVANEFLEADVSDQDLEDMMQEIDQSGDGLLTVQDFYRLANQIHL